MNALLADAVVVSHLFFLALVALGSVLAWRWPRVLWLHVPAVAWALVSVLIRVECPLTDLEKWLRRRAGEQVYDGGFIDHYLGGTLYPMRLEVAVGVFVAGLVVCGYVDLWWRRRGRRRAQVEAAA